MERAEEATRGRPAKRARRECAGVGHARTRKVGDRWGPLSPHFCVDACAETEGNGALLEEGSGVQGKSTGPAGLQGIVNVAGGT